MHGPGVGGLYRIVTLLQLPDNGLLRLALRFLALDILKKPAAIGHLFKNADFGHQHQHHAHGLPIVWEFGMKPLRGKGAAGNEKRDQTRHQDGSTDNDHFSKMLHRLPLIAFLYPVILTLKEANFRPTQ